MQGAFDEGRSATKNYQLLLVGVRLGDELVVVQVEHADHGGRMPLAMCELQKRGDLLHLSSVMVRPSFRRLGLARQLLRKARRIA
ncbi:unnamed protein product, partial [Cladocopium goreaui]